MVELLVSIAVISVLLSLLLPAIQYVRESARKTQCKSNLHQIGIAIQNYHDSIGCLPIREWFGSHVPLLPWLERKDLHDLFADQTPMTIGLGMNDIRKIRIPVFTCPSDSLRSSLPIGGLNYGWNNGSGWIYEQNGVVNVVDFPYPIRLSDITDGVSNTACQSEVLYTDNSLKRLRTVWFVSPAMRTIALWPAFLQACESLPETGGYVSTSFRGESWTVLELYNHARPPQHRTCENGFQGIDGGVYPATSEHNTGAHTLMLDGSVRFVSQSIDGKLWEALGTRNSGDAVSSSF